MKTEHEIKDMTPTFPMSTFVVHNADLRVFGYDIAVMVTKEDFEGLKNVVRSLGDGKLTYTSYKMNNNGKPSLFIRTRIDPKQKDSLMGKDLIFTINPSTGTGDLILISEVEDEFAVSKVIFNDPATIVYWCDGTKTVVKCGENDIYDPEKGLAMAISKKIFGNKGNYYNQFKKWLPKEETNTSDNQADEQDDYIKKSDVANDKNPIESENTWGF